LTIQSVALPRAKPRARLHLDAFREEPAISSLVRLFTPNPRSPERYVTQYRYRASIALSHNFTLPRVRSTGFGSYPGNFRHFHTTPHAAKQLRACRFRYGYAAEQLNLTTEINSLPRSSKRMVQHCKPPVVLRACARFLPGSTFRAVPDYRQLGFRFFSPRFRGAFQPSVIILLRYRTPDVFRVTG
jgi:hypothetical protein